VGVGKSNPSYVLDVLGDVASSASIRGSNLSLINPSTANNTNILNASGGDSVIVANGTRIHMYTTVQTTTFVVNRTVAVNILIVAGGGAGGRNISNNNRAGGGGGAGGLIYVSQTLTPGTYNVTVGDGGTATGGTGNNGGNSVFWTYTAIGGGGGGRAYDGGGSAGNSGGSGGGGGDVNGGAGGGTSGQGNAGGASSTTNIGNGNGGGGGGGAGGAGALCSNSSGPAAGGSGLSYSITGTAVTYSTGGAGGVNYIDSTTSGAANTGNGGYGTRNTTPGNGGSGIVIIAYSYTASTINISPSLDTLIISGNVMVTGSIQTANQSSSAMIFYLLSSVFTQKLTFSGNTDTTTTLPSSSIPSTARAIWADVFVTSSLQDHQIYWFGAVSNGGATCWTDGGWGANPQTYLGNMNNQITRMYVEGDQGIAAAYCQGLRGVWYSSQIIPIAANGVMYYGNSGNSGSSGYMWLMVKGYFM